MTFQGVRPLKKLIWEIIVALTYILEVSGYSKKLYIYVLLACNYTYTRSGTQHYNQLFVVGYAR